LVISHISFTVTSQTICTRHHLTDSVLVIMPGFVQSACYRRCC